MNAETLSMKKAILCILALAFFVPCAASASIGVGVGTGKIVVDQPMKPGGIYQLAPVMVLNTGDEPSDYEVTVQYNEKQDQLKPPSDWFSFSPATFHLDPGQARAVTTAISLPVNAKPGDYFAYLEAHPVQTDKEGSSRIGIAAAAKLYFSVAPANIFQAAYYRAASLLTRYAPWTYVVLIVIAAVLFLSILRRFVSFNVSFRKKS